MITDHSSARGVPEGLYQPLLSVTAKKVPASPAAIPAPCIWIVSVVWSSALAFRCSHYQENVEPDKADSFGFLSTLPSDEDNWVARKQSTSGAVGTHLSTQRPDPNLVTIGHLLSLSCKYTCALMDLTQFLCCSF